MDVVAAVVHLAPIPDVVHLVQEVLVHQHHPVVHIVDQDLEVIIENHRDVPIIIVNNNQIIMEKDEVVAQHAAVGEREMVHAVVEHNPMTIYVVQHQIEMV
jgi:hypothetical protein